MSFVQLLVICGAGVAAGRGSSPPGPDGWPPGRRAPSLGLVDKRVFGMSNSYRVVSAAGQWQLSPEEAERRLFGAVASGDLPPTVVVLSNGGRLRLDVAGRPQYATPECGSAPDLVVHDKACERILEGMPADVDQRLGGEA